MSLVEFLGDEFIKYRNSREAQGYRGVDWSDFAAYLGVEYQSLVRWKNGGSEPSWSNIKQLANKLGTKVYEQAGEPELMPSDPIFRDIAENWHRLTPQEGMQVRDVQRRLIEGHQENDQSGSGENQLRFA